jgi:fimbrial chaperone protein
MVAAPSARKVALGTLAALALTVMAGAASAYQITPISQNFEPSGKGATQTFQVVNDSDQQVTVTIKIATREVDIDGKEVHNATKDFSVFPTEIVLAPRATQVVRAKWLGDAAPKTELAYRLIAEETPLKNRRDTPGASIYMTVRYVGSLYVVPKGVRPDLKVLSATPVTGAAGRSMLELLVENSGSAHAVLENPTLTLKSGAMTKVLRVDEIEGVLQGENVLAQHRRRLTIAMPNGFPPGPVEAALVIQPTR